MTTARSPRLHFLASRGEANKMQPSPAQSGHTFRKHQGARRRVSAAEDQADVENVLAGDASAFEGIVRRWQGPIVNLAYRFCRDRTRAEDMAQEAFLRAFRSLASWRREAAFSTWLFALATNLFRNDLRRFPAGMIPLDELPELADSHAVDGGLENEDRDRVVRTAVYALPAKYREAILLFYFHEMDVAAAARSLGLPEGTLKARLFRGREILRGKLARRGVSPGSEEEI
jgi:RNA polymerase sigma-70 factor (ECF subfamily)